MLGSAFLKPQAGEKLIFFLRRHWLTFVKLLVFHIFLIVIPPLLYFIFKADATNLLRGEIWGPLLKLGISIYYLSVWLFLFAAFIDYYLDIWIVTNERIINIEQKGLFARTVSEVKLYNIQDVTSEVKGILSTMFDFGNVYVQTAAEKERFIFRNIAAPARIAQSIIELSEKAKGVKK
ncbi:MAG: PH domain-containing protein [Patescibacteria group bacterium]|nr:PH domain-containing protein [Patescibacteria group bacterium]MDD5490848.1 PH domain-containing protein [Patescibacteria group bacterium]